MFKIIKKQLCWLKKTARFLVVSEHDYFSSERINSNAFLFSGFLISVLSCIFNFLEGFNTFLNIFTIFSSGILIILYYFSRFRNLSNIWLSASVVLLLLSVSWFMNSGAIGSTSFMYLYTVIVLTIIAERRQQNGLFLLIFFNIIVLYLLEFFFGAAIVRPYINSSNQYSDIIFVFLLILIGVFFTTRFIKRSYDKEKDIVKQRTDELELSNEKRTNVFINLAHETKTPLTLITNYLNDYIHKNKKQDDEDLILLKNTVDHLTRDIVNFFDMEKIQKGIMLYNHNQVLDYSKILKDRITLFKPLADKKEITIHFFITDALFAKADPGALIRIINNLIENAIKYTPTGGAITVELSKTGDNICLSVKDNGIGIPVSLRSKIFEPYFQINSEKANFQGIGLGLSIVNKIVQELNGSIELKSVPDIVAGTHMTVLIPSHGKIANACIEWVEDTSISLEAQKLKIMELPLSEDKFTIMVVEDNIALLNYIVDTLQKNYNVYFAVNGKTAIKKLETIQMLDLIVSDVMMDNGDGFYLYEYIALSKRFKHIPFIFLTAKQEEEARMKGLSIGAIDYINKPFVIDELNKKINAVLTNLSIQRDAIITNAYHSIIKNGKEIENDSFERNFLKYNLTTRETEIIRLIAEGKINKEIAVMLCISIDTVKKHIQNSYEKVRVNNKIELLKKLGG